MHNDGELFVKNTDFQNPKTQRKISQKEKEKSLHQRFSNAKNDNEINRN